MPTFPSPSDLVSALTRGDGTTEAHSVDHGRVIEIWENVKNYGAYGDGNHDDSIAIQAAITVANNAGGGTIYFPSGTYMCNITIYPKIKLVGANIGATILKAPASSNTNVITGVNFSALTNKVYAVNDTERGAYDCHIESMTIDGNKSNNAAGYGIQVWGKGLIFYNITVQNCYDGGIWTEFTTHDAGAVEDEPGGHFANIKVSNNGGNGWVFRGPHDSVIQNFTTWSNTGWGLYSDYSSGSYNGTLGHCAAWNSWLNANSFYFAVGPQAIDGVAATGSNTGNGIELAAAAGAAKFMNSTVAGHDIGLLLRGSNHMFHGLVQQCTVGVELAGNMSASILNLSLSSTNTTGIVFTSESGGNTLQISANIGANTLYSGTPHATDIITISQIGNSNLSKLFLGAISMTTGNGAPNGVITADPGSLYLRNNHEVANEVLYVKETGYGNTGWVAK